jgi:hypothetical protein
MQVYGVNSGDEVPPVRPLLSSPLCRLHHLESLQSSVLTQDLNGIGPNAATETCDVRARARATGAQHRAARLHG